MYDIHIMDIRKQDLNLLATFVVISEELNLSRASQRLGLSQPALSHALSRLRKQFSDPLFVRGQRGLVATPRVNTLLPQVRVLLVMAEKLYHPGKSLNLTSISRRVVIASTAYFEIRAMGRFIKQAQAKAPGLRIETRSLSGGFPKRELESGEFDLAIAAYFDNLPNAFKIKNVFSEHFVCVCSKKNAYLKTKRTTADYLAAKHLQIEIPPGVFAPVDRHLEQTAQQRHILLRIGNFLTPPAILSKSEFLLTCPSSLAESYKRIYPITITELPFRLPALHTQMVWHEKDQEDPFHMWLRNELSAAASHRISGEV